MRRLEGGKVASEPEIFLKLPSFDSYGCSKGIAINLQNPCALHAQQVRIRR
jgi:hypothetical protein